MPKVMKWESDDFELQKSLIFLKALAPEYQTSSDGEIVNLIGTADSVYEDITVTLTSSTTFAVTGSVTGGIGYIFHNPKPLFMRLSPLSPF